MSREREEKSTANLSWTATRHAIANTIIGVVFFFCFLAGVLHFNGVWYGQFLPMSDSTTYDNMGHAYDIGRILNADFTLNEEAYKNYSPLFIRYAPSRDSMSRPVTWVVAEDERSGNLRLFF